MSRHHRRTPIRIVNGKTLAWVKNKGKPFALNNNLHDIVATGSFYLAKPEPGAVVLHQPWGKPHITHMASPRPETAPRPEPAEPAL
jgi:hypothetical protein